MRITLKLVVALVMVAIGLFWPAAAGALERSEGESVRAGDRDDKDAADPAAKKKKKKKKKKKEEKKEKKEEVTADGDILPYAVGLKIGLMPFNDMDTTEAAGGGTVRDYDYDFGAMWGWGVGGQYRLMKNVYLLGELAYWYPRVDERSNVIESSDTQPEYKESDGLLNIGGGLRINVLGNDFTTDRVYARGMFGFADYMSDEKNVQDKGDRTGYYFSAGAGIEHTFGNKISVYADGGYMWASLSSDAETEVKFDGWLGMAGFLLHWGKK